MSTRERILVIRLLDMARRQPECAASLGLEIMDGNRRIASGRKEAEGIGGKDYEIRS